MSFTEGADVDALAHSVAKLAELAQQLVEVDGAVTASIGRLKTVWGGHDLDRFVGKHQSQVQPTLRRISQHARVMGEELGRQMAEQRLGSNVEGGIGPRFDAGNVTTGGGGYGDDVPAKVTSGAGVERSAVDQLTKRPDSDDADASVTIAKTEASWENSTYHRSGDHYDVKALGAEASASGSVTINDGAINAKAAVSASAYLGSASVHGDIGPASLSGSAMVGAEASAEGKLSAGPGGVVAGVKADAFVGAKAEVEAGVDLGVGEVKAGAQAYAGAGVRFDAKAELKDGKIKAGIDMGAALGVGLGYTVDVTIDTGQIVKGAGDIAKGAGDVVKGAGDVVKAAGGHLPKWLHF